MKKILIALTVLAATACAAAPHYNHRIPSRMAPVVHRGPQPKPVPLPHYHHRHNDSWWGKGGRNFWPGFTGSLIGSLFAQTTIQQLPLPPSPPPPPVILMNPVWVPPVYGTRPIYDVYGRIIRYELYVITPGYWK